MVALPDMEKARMGNHPSNFPDRDCPTCGDSMKLVWYFSIDTWYAIEGHYFYPHCEIIHSEGIPNG